MSILEMIEILNSGELKAKLQALVCSNERITLKAYRDDTTQ